MKEKQNVPGDGAHHFKLPVDSEHKATIIKLNSIALPHMRAFHLSWMAFHTVFFSTFAPAGLLPFIRDDISATQTDLGNAGVTAVVGAIGARIFMGSLLDAFGPRFCFSGVLLLTSPAAFCLALVQTPTEFVVVRFFVGISLSAFVCCQFWCSSMFNTKIVGTANAMAGGWGTMGGGMCQLIMPLVAVGLQSYVPMYQAWRWAFMVPGGMHVIFGTAVLLLSQDLPDGDYRTLRSQGTMAKANGRALFAAATFNYRTWIMMLNYGYCFGIELTVDNQITTYMFDQFALKPAVAGMFGSIFGLMNIFSRATGGFASDTISHYFGMRGRLWLHWSCQTMCGLLCMLLGTQENSLDNTIVVLVIFSFFTQASAGTTFGIVPFISKRSLGLVSGYVGAGGNTGSAVTQAIFFVSGNFTKPQGFFWMGVMVMCVTTTISLVYFPMWGSMFFGPQTGVTEEDYYLAEFSPEEIAQGIAAPSVRFATESKSQRGRRSGKGTPPGGSIRNGSGKGAAAATAAATANPLFSAPSVEQPLPEHAAPVAQQMTTLGGQQHGLQKAAQHEGAIGPVSSVQQGAMGAPAPSAPQQGPLDMASANHHESGNVAVVPDGEDVVHQRGPPSSTPADQLDGPMPAAQLQSEHHERVQGVGDAAVDAASPVPGAQLPPTALQQSSVDVSSRV